MLVAGSAAPATPKPSGLGVPPAQAVAPTPTAQPLQIPSSAPAPRIVTTAVNNLSPEQRLVGLALLVVGVLGLLAILGRRLVLRPRRKPAALPNPRTPPRPR